MAMNVAEKFQVIIAISTIEHIGQRSAPGGDFGEINGKVDLEAPLKAIARLYDLLDVGGRALLTVPFGKLTAGGWYVQFSAEYLELLITRYSIPREALAVAFLRQVARERKWHNPHQRWVEERMDELREIRYDTLSGGARAIAVLELTKLAQPFTLNLAVPPMPLVYERDVLYYHFLAPMGHLRRRAAQ